MKITRWGAVIGAGIAVAALLTGCTPPPGGEPGRTSAPTDVTSIQDDLIKASDPGKSPAAAEKRTDTFVSTINEPGGVFLPFFYDNGWDGNAVQPIFSSLVVFDDSGEPIPDLAESWDVSDDGLEFTFHLRDGLTFADGSPLTAEDVKFTLTLLNDPSFSGSIDLTDVGIAGADDYKKGDADEISGITVLDDQTVRIATTKVNPLSLSKLGGPVLSKAYYGKGYKKGQLDYLRELYGKPLGDGPYQLEQYVTGEELRYKANPRYYGGEPKIPYLIFKITQSPDQTLQFFQNGDIDQGGFNTDQDTLNQLKDLGFANIKIRTIPDIGVIYVNNAKPYLKDTEMRQALYYGLDRQQIVDAKYQGLGQVADVFAAPTQWSYTTKGVTAYPFDPDKANELLDDLGWKPGADGIREKDGKRLTISYLTRADDDPIIPIGEQDYQEIGIDFVPEVVDVNTLFDRFTAGDYDLISLRTNGLVDPNDAVGEFASDDPAVNPSGYHDDKVSDLIAQGISEQDQDARKAIYQKLYQALSEDPPVILVDYRKGVSAWNDRIAGGETFVTGSGDSSLALPGLSIR